MFKITFKLVIYWQWKFITSRHSQSAFLKLNTWIKFIVFITVETKVISLPYNNKRLIVWWFYCIFQESRLRVQDYQYSDLKRVYDLKIAI